MAKYKTSGFNVNVSAQTIKCIRNISNPNRDDKEIYRIWLKTGDYALSNPNSLLNVKYKLPKGMKLKLAYTKYHSFNAPGDFNLPSSIGNLIAFDYQTLFENVIYEGQMATVDIPLVDETVDFSIPQNIIDLNNSDSRRYAYIIIETDESIYEGGEFEIFNINVLDPSNSFSQVFVSESEQDYVYAAVSVNSTNKSYFKSTDGGVTFNKLNGVYLTEDFDGSHFKNEFHVDKLNPDVFYFGGLRYLVKNVTIGSNVVSFFPNHVRDFHDDLRSMFLDYSSGTTRALYGTDGGLCFDTDLSSDLPFENLNYNSATTLIYQLDIHENSKTGLIGLQDNGTSQFYLNGGYFNGTGGDGSITYIHPNNSNHIIKGDPQSPGISSINETGGDIINDLVLSNTTSGILAAEPYLGMTIEPYRYKPDRFLVGLNKIDSALGAPYILNTASQQTEKKYIFEMELIHSIGICEKNENIVYFGEGLHINDEDKLMISTDGGVTPPQSLDNSIYNDIIFGPQTLKNTLSGRYITEIAVHPRNANEVYVGVSGSPVVNDNFVDEYKRILKSTDFGQTFEDFSQGLPALPVKKILPIESGTNLMFCAIDGGVYYRMDGMNRWECFNNNLPLSYNMDLDFDYCSKELYLATYGRGVWKTKVNFDLSSEFGEEITSNTTWNTSKDQLENIIVKAGKTLTIQNATIRMRSDLKIVVEQGAKLIVDNSTITNSCGGIWKGIQVYGNSNLTQTAANQGTLILKNNAVIENAHEAIQVWKKDAWNTGGGIVDASNTTFRNNRRSVAFYPYHTYSPTGIEYNNKSKFVQCNFIWDNNFNTAFTIEAAATVFQVNGVGFYGCVFDEQRTGISLPQRHKGIGIHDAKVVVSGKVINPLLPEDAVYSTSNFIVSVFKNLYYGIEAGTGVTQSNIVVDHCRFENNFRGVQLAKMDNSRITRNRFENTALLPGVIAPHIDLVLDKSTGYKVEGNQFYSSNPTIATAGVYVQNSGTAPNTIYRNEYDNLKFGNYAAYQNQNGLNLDDQLTGLEFICNDNTNPNGVDEYSFISNQTDITQGIRLKQGLASNPAKNTFTPTPVGNPNQVKHLWSLDNSSLLYYGFNTSVEIPVFNSSSVGVNLTVTNKTCPSTFQTIVVGTPGKLTEGVKTQLITEFNSDLTLKAQKTNDLTILLANGSSASLLNAVNTMTNSNKQQVRNQVDAQSPYVSEEIARALRSKSNGLVPPGWYKDLILSNIELAQDEEFMLWLEQNIPAGHANQIRTSRSVNSTQKTIKTDEIIAINDRIAANANTLIQDALASEEEIDWSQFNTWVVNRGDVLCKLQLADAFLQRKQITECNTKLTEIEQEAGQITTPVVAQEMLDFVTFKRYILAITKNTGVIERLEKNQIDQLINIRDKFVGTSAVQAGNILCFYAGKCLDRELPNDNKSALQGTNETINSTSIIPSLINDLLIVPNPNSGSFTVEMLNECAVKEVLAFDALGKRVDLIQESRLNNKIDVSLIQPLTGIYIIKITCADGTTSQARLLVK